MDLLAGLRRLVLGFGLILLAGAVTLPAAEPAESPQTNAPPKSAEESAEAQRILRSYLHLQEQLHATLLAIEQARMENALAARTNSETLATRLKLIEDSLLQSREQQMESMRHSSRTMLTLAGVFVSVGFLTLLLMAFFQLRGMNRLAEIATGLPGGHFPAALEPGDARLIGPGGGGLQTVRLHGLIERLEGRIHELETAAHAGHSSNGPGERKPLLNLRDGNPGAPSHTTLLLGKGLTLLNLGQPEGALDCFDEALAQEPDNAEVHLRKGMALERLKRLDEAVACCDRAIALDRSLTQAYLCKGSLFNQQERYNEALECYEQALRAEAKA